MTLVDQLREALGPGSVFEATEDVVMYEYDYGLDRAMPQLVALPRSTAEVQAIVRAARAPASRAAPSRRGAAWSCHWRA